MAEPIVKQVIEVGAFLLEEPIGEGGVCRVWRGTHRQRNFPIACKVFLNEIELSPEMLEAFQKEVRSVASLDHPAIVRVFDYGSIDESTEQKTVGALRSGSPYLAMELAEGSLSPLCGKLEWPSLYQILMSILDALAHAHARGVIHRDIKPENILTYQDSSIVKLTDFGLAFGFEQDGIPLNAGKLTGTPMYMAPEQFSGSWRDYGPWTDMYALGGTAYTLLCGHAPFEHCQALSELVMAHLTWPIPPCSSNSIFPDAFCTWLEKMMAKEPSKRFQRAADAAYALAKLHASWNQDMLEQTVESPAPTPDSLVTRQMHQSQYALAIPSKGLFRTQPENSMREDVASESVEDVLKTAPTLPPVFTGMETTHDKTAGRQKQITKDEEFISQSHLKTIAMQQHQVEERSQHSREKAVKAERIEKTPRAPDTSNQTFSKKKMGFDFPPLPSTWRQPKLVQSEAFQHVGLGLHGFRTIPFVDREEERQTLWHLMEQVIQHKVARCVVIQGEVGCGKSRLAAWLCQRTHELGISNPLRAFHRSIGGEKGGLAAMLARHLGCSGLTHQETLRQLSRRLKTEDTLDEQDLHTLAEFLTPATEKERRENPLSVRFSSSQERHGVLYRFLKILSQRRLVIVWLDDVQWGLDALDFVLYVMNQQEREPFPILFLLTAQSEAHSQRTYEKICLERLNAAGTDHLALSNLEAQYWPVLIRNILELSKDLASQVEQWTAGHPLFAIQLLEHWIHLDWLRPTASGFGVKQPNDFRQPEDLSELWKERLAHLFARRTPGEKTAFELAALLGQSINRTEWKKVCKELGLTLPLELVEKMLHQRLLVRAEEQDVQQWYFANEAIRIHLEEQAQNSPHWQRYSKIITMLLQKDNKQGSAERLGRHLLRAGQNRQALEALLEAIRADLTRGEEPLAIALFQEWEETLKKADIPEHDALWSDYYYLQFQMCYLNSEYETAKHWSQRAEEHARKYGWRDTLLELLCERAPMYWSTGLVTEAWDGLEEAKRLARELRKRTWQAKVHLARGKFLKARGSLEEAIAETEQANLHYIQLADPVGIGQSLFRQGVIYKQKGEFAKATSYTQQAQTCFEQWGARTLTAHCHSLLGELARLQGKQQAAETYYQSAIAHYQTLQMRAEVTCRLNLVLLWLEQDRYHKAFSQIQDCLFIVSHQSDQVLLGICECSLLPCLSSWGDWKAWDTHLQSGTKRLLQVSFFDVDLARILERTAEHCVLAQQMKRAQLAYQMVLEQYQTLNSPQDVHRIQTRLAGLKASS